MIVWWVHAGRREEGVFPAAGARDLQRGAPCVTTHLQLMCMPVPGDLNAAEARRTCSCLHAPAARRPNGMWMFNEETRCYWFKPRPAWRPTSFTLVGQLMGLAIYNSVIIEAHFPLALYTKLP